MTLNFSDVVKKAEGRTQKFPPFEMELEGEVYKIPYPDALQTLEFSELREEQTLAQLRVLFSYSPEAWNALVRELRGKDSAVLQVIVESMFAFWRQHDKSAGKLLESVE